jgi:hypothetical protein
LGLCGQSPSDHCFNQPHSRPGACAIADSSQQKLKRRNRAPRAVEIHAEGSGDAGIEARVRVLSAQVLREASAAMLETIRRAGSATSIVRG